MKEKITPLPEISLIGINIDFRQNIFIDQLIVDTFTNKYNIIYLSDASNEMKSKFLNLNAHQKLVFVIKSKIKSLSQQNQPLGRTPFISYKNRNI